MKCESRGNVISEMMIYEDANDDDTDDDDDDAADDVDEEGMRGEEGLEPY